MILNKTKMATAMGLYVCFTRGCRFLQYVVNIHTVGYRSNSVTNRYFSIDTDESIDNFKSSIRIQHLHTIYRLLMFLPCFKSFRQNRSFHSFVLYSLTTRCSYFGRFALSLSPYLLFSNSISTKWQYVKCCIY